MTDLGDATGSRPMLAVEIERAMTPSAFRFRHAERVAEEFSFWTHRGECSWRHEPCDQQGEYWIGEQGARLEAAEHASKCPSGWLLSAYEHVDGTWRIRPEVPRG